MSLIPHSGLLGVSSHTSLVAPGFNAPASAGKSSASTKSTLSPWACASFASQARKAQYMLLRRDDMRAGSEAQENRDRRRHARAEDERRRRAFERSDHSLRFAHGVVVGTAIRIAAAIKVVGVALEGRCEMDRRNDRAGALVDQPQRLGGEGART